MRRVHVLFIVTVISVVLLLFVSFHFQDERVATVSQVSVSKDYVRIQVVEFPEPIIVFGSLSQKLYEGDRIIFIASVQEYKGEPQFVARKISKIIS